MAHYTPLMVMILVTATLVLLIVFFQDNDVILAYSVVSLFLSIIVLLVLLSSGGDATSSKDFKVKLLLEVITCKPAVKGKEWRIITHIMIHYLLDNSLLNTPYYFYCEKKCSKFFESLVEQNRSSKYSSSSTSAAENTQSLASENEVSNGVATSHIFTSDPDLEAYFINAAELFKEAQFEYWRKQYPDADLP
ncbi:hypothetical protein SMKI_01G0810 [Saccharomyces mikatae IFO 1815]|uniref:Uncharacterized protein n=1 Tax=Saccharomyces mikatae IFO 1815 TaxID=226126 RepID=A0AA35IVV3_SACMI|nr:uncharacterized protein SMKI_01G0810 [Saccharomyces mikatae IFO 1815]CAI4037122.1 hypothetical protein SMKI_01G0810 [Saccharomyces mikatae IFO 1815]